MAVVPARALSWQRVQLPPGLALGAGQQTPRLRSVLEGLLEDRLLDDAPGRLRPVPYGEQRWRAERSVDVEQGHLREIAGQSPPPAMPLLRLDVALVTKTGHDSPNHHGVGVHGFRHLLGRQGPLVLPHVQQDVKHARKSAVSYHVTYNVS